MARNSRTVFLMSGGLCSTTLLYEMTIFQTAKDASIIEAMLMQTSENDTNSFMGARVICDKLGIPTTLWDYTSEPLLNSIFGETAEKPEGYREACEAHLFKTLITTAIHRAFITPPFSFCASDKPPPQRRL